MGMVGCFAAADAATIRRLKFDPNEIEKFLSPDDGESEPPHYIDVDKAWHCIHFMLCGRAGTNSNPLSMAVLGGEEIGDDVGYGPARILQPDQVRIVATALAPIDAAAFNARFVPQAMQEAEIYLSDMCVRDGNEALEYLRENYLSLVAFYLAAADRGDGAVLWLS